MAEPADLAAAIADRYRIERELGAGGMATVYLAHDVRHDRKVALKVLREEVATALGPERFLQEIRTTARLQHPHILPLLDSGEVPVGHPGRRDGPSRLFYVMPYVQGETLRQRLERERTLPLADVVRLTGQLAAALESAHRQGVIHRDIKPENILLSDGLPLLADFGIALAVQHAGGDRLTTVGVSLGTPAYMSPEQVVATREVDARADLYSLACIVFEAIAGRPPYRGATSFATMADHVTAPIPALSAPGSPVPPAVSDVVRRALAKDPADRYATVTEFAAALSAAVDPPRPAAGSSSGEKSIVVLPFDNHSPDPNDAYLADGLTEELTADLARVQTLRVTARNSAVAAKARTRDVREIARLLGTRYVLEGSVRRAGNALRITAQLIDGETDGHLWSEKYGGSMDDVFEMQERISRTIVDALAVKLSTAERSDLAARPIADLEAYQLYLQARQCLRDPMREPLARARDLLGRAMAIAGENDVLLGLLGVLEVLEYSMGYGATDDKLRRGDACASRALAINPRAAHALYAKAIVAEKTNLAVSVHYLRQAAAADPTSSATGLLAFGLAVRGEPDALRYARRAAELDPLSPLVLGWAALSAWYGNAVEEALHWVTAGLRAAPDSAWIQWCGGYILAASGKRDEGLVLLDRGAASDEELMRDMSVLLARALRHEPVEHLERLAQSPMRVDPHGSQMVAESYAAGGQRADALDWLRNAITLGVVNATYMAERSPFFASLRGDPEFDALMAQARARAAREGVSLPNAP